MPRTVNPTQPPPHPLKILPISSGTVAGILQVGFGSGGRPGKATHAPGLSFLKGRKMGGGCVCVCVSTHLRENAYNPVPVLIWSAEREEMPCSDLS